MMRIMGMMRMVRIMSLALKIMRIASQNNEKG